MMMGHHDMLALAAGEMKMAPRTILPVRMSGKPIWSEWDTDTAITRGLKSSGIVYTCIMRNANAIASIPWQAQRKSRDGKWVHVPEHQLQRLIDRPNPFWTRQRLVTLNVMELLLSGNSVVCKVRLKPGEVPINLFTVRPQRIMPIPTKDIHVSAYSVLAADGKRYVLGSNDAIHHMLPDPSCPYWGLSPMQAASRSIDVDRESADWQKSMLENHMVPPGVFTIEGSMLDEEFDEHRAMMAEQYQGALNSRSPLLLGGEVKWQQLSTTAAELDFKESRKLTREEIASVFGVPPPVVGLLDRATYNNIETARAIWWEDTLLPLIASLGDMYTIQLANEWGDDMRLWPDTSKVPALLYHLLKQMQVVNEMVKGGAPWNTAAEYVGIPLQIPGGHQGYLPANMVPLSDLGGPISDDMAPFSDAQPPTVDDDLDSADRADPIEGFESEEATAKRFKQWLNN